MKQFSFPIILGLALGSVLIGYIVFAAFTSPTQAPPGGNVPVPLNVGPETQTKQGKLIISGGIDSPRVGTPQLCLGPLGGEICKNTWPAGLEPTDVVAFGYVQNAARWRTCYTKNRGSCAGSYVGWFTEYSASDWDPRGVLSLGEQLGILPSCLGPPDCQPQTNRVYNLQCAQGWSTDYNHPVARIVQSSCSPVGAGCTAAVCRLYSVPPPPPPCDPRSDPYC